MEQKEIPVFMFLGFLESGKTTFIQSTLEEPDMDSGDRVLVLICEEGEVELDPSRFKVKNVVIRTLSDKSELTEQNLSKITREAKADRIMIEYNGMWLLQDLFDVIPEDWAPCQFVSFFESSTFMNYNSNMRQLVFDKLQLADMVVFNRFPTDIDFMPYHKVARQATRRSEIIFEKTDGKVFRDTVEDPLPFDINADLIDIEDRDYAYFYADLNDNPEHYQNKVVRFKGLIGKDKRLPKDVFIIGRHLMNCCAADIQYAGLVAKYDNASEYKTGDWIVLTAKIEFEYNKIYGDTGPVFKFISAARTVEPEDPVATFY